MPLKDMEIEFKLNAAPNIYGQAAISHKVSRGSLGGSNKIWINKEMADPATARREHLVQSFFKLIIPHQPETRLLWNSQTKTYHILSEEVPGYRALPIGESANFGNGTYKGLGQALVSAMVVQEIDLKNGNIGLDDQNRVIKIDGDWGFAQTTKGFSEQRYNITPDGLNKLPYPNSFYAWNWLDIMQIGMAQEASKIVDMSLSSNPQFRAEVNQAMLKICLLPDGYIERFVDAIIPAGGEQFVTLLKKRREELKIASLQNESFQIYLKSENATSDAQSLIMQMNSFIPNGEDFVIQASDHKIMMDEVNKNLNNLKNKSLLKEKKEDKEQQFTAHDITDSIRKAGYESAVCGTPNINNDNTVKIQFSRKEIQNFINLENKSQPPLITIEKESESSILIKVALEKLDVFYEKIKSARNVEIESKFSLVPSLIERHEQQVELSFKDMKEAKTWWDDTVKTNPELNLNANKKILGNKVILFNSGPKSEAKKLEPILQALKLKIGAKKFQDEKQEVKQEIKANVSKPNVLKAEMAPDAHQIISKQTSQAQELMNFVTSVYKAEAAPSINNQWKWNVLFDHRKKLQNKDFEIVNNPDRNNNNDKGPIALALTDRNLKNKYQIELFPSHNNTVNYKVYDVLNKREIKDLAEIEKIFDIFLEQCNLYNIHYQPAGVNVPIPEVKDNIKSLGKNQPKPKSPEVKQEYFKNKLNEITKQPSEKVCAHYFFETHKKLFEQNKGNFTNVKPNWGLKEILHHAMNNASLSRHACMELGWLNKDGTLNNQKAPDVVKEVFDEINKEIASHQPKL